MKSEEKANMETPIPPEPSLFPILQQPIGVARMAAESEHLDDGHQVDFRGLEVKSILNKSVSKRLKWLCWSINPYRGCEFGCRYCYARYTHEFMELRDPLAFERQIFAKQNAAWLLRQELRDLQRKGRIHEEIALGTATDPWQPIERRLRITRSLLEVMTGFAGLRLGVVSKSTLLARDIDLFQQIARQGTLVVHITVTTDDVELARKLEPRAPRPDLRLQTIRRLTDAGITVGMLNSPLMPGITDTAPAMDRMAAHAAAAGASFFSAGPLFLKPCSRPTYLSFVREHFPHLEPEYTRRFQARDFADKAYAARMRSIVAAVSRKHGLGTRMTNNTLLTRTMDDGKKPAQSHLSRPFQARLFG